MFCDTENLFTLLSHWISLSTLPFDFSSLLLLFLWSIKEPRIQTPKRWLFRGTSLPSSLSAVSLIKVSSLPQPFISQIHWLVMWWAEWAWTQEHFHWLMAHFFLLLSSIPLHAYGRKNNFSSTLVGSCGLWVGWKRISRHEAEWEENKVY